MLGFSRNACNNVEVGSTRIGINMAFTTLRRKFGVTPDWVYVGDEAMMPHHLMVQIERLGAKESQSPGEIRMISRYPSS